jgi:hypothetical protein
MNGVFEDLDVRFLYPTKACSMSRVGLGGAGVSIYTILYRLSELTTKVNMGHLLNPIYSLQTFFHRGHSPAEIHAAI